jgi:hypothetical protein
MIHDVSTGWTEATIIVNGHRLSFAESLSVRVAIGGFRIQLSDAEFRAALGAELAEQYDHHLTAVEHYIHMRTDD